MRVVTVTVTVTASDPAEFSSNIKVLINNVTNPIKCVVLSFALEGGVKKSVTNWDVSGGDL
jgi:hypothetical protein